MTIIYNIEELKDYIGVDMFDVAIDTDGLFIHKRKDDYPILIDSIGIQTFGIAIIKVYKIYTKRDMRELAIFGEFMQYEHE